MMAIYPLMDFCKLECGGRKLPSQLGCRIEVLIFLLSAEKDALAPNGILNPRKMFTLFKVWEYSRLKIELPWDHK